MLCAARRPVPQRRTSLARSPTDWQAAGKDKIQATKNPRFSRNILEIANWRASLRTNIITIHYRAPNTRRSETSDSNRCINPNNLHRVLKTPPLTESAELAWPRSKLFTRFTRAPRAAGEAPRRGSSPVGRTSLATLASVGPISCELVVLADSAPTKKSLLNATPTRPKRQHEKPLLTR